MTPIADDFAGIAAAVKDLNIQRAMDEVEASVKAALQQKIYAPTLTEDPCPKCDGGGWVFSSYQASHGPNFEECPECGNPEDHRSP